MKIIFLDIDGVLNNRVSLLDGVQLVNEKCILLRDLCEATKAKIVLSSSWRIGENLESLSTMLWRCGGPYKTIIDKTPDTSHLGSSRGHEIKQWLENTNLHIDTFVIIDDDADFLEAQKKYFIHTSFKDGLTLAHIEKIKAILNQENIDD